MQYTPGLHLLLSIRSVERDILSHSSNWKDFIHRQIEQYGLTLVGEVLHDFNEGGYTAVHCLTESHISVHTWPEYGVCTCDVFLSNFRNDNHPIVRAIGEAIIQYFGSPDGSIQEVIR
jgi:S-adenosylmethionine decarboxylase